MSIFRIAGYCEECRNMEIHLYGTALNTTDDRHVLACEKAGCQHPAVLEMDYSYKDGPTDELTFGED